jgi:Core-2/I-Branching enzyme
MSTTSGHSYRAGHALGSETLLEKKVEKQESNSPFTGLHQYLFKYCTDSEKIRCTVQDKPNRERFTDLMGEEVSKAWRKSSQWMSLTRRHADLAVNDTTIYPKFKEHCTGGYDNHLKRSPLANFLNIWPISPTVCTVSGFHAQG